MAKSCSQPVNLPGARPLMNPLPQGLKLTEPTELWHNQILGSGCCLHKRMFLDQASFYQLLPFHKEVSWLQVPLGLAVHTFQH